MPIQQENPTKYKPKPRNINGDTRYKAPPENYQEKNYRPTGHNPFQEDLD